MHVIELNNISKCFTVHATPLQSAVSFVAPTLAKSQTIWALKDINLKVERGECVGIIGNNGSGKSTLLKLISGILKPTSGDMNIHGNISFLLDLSVGMQKELSGRRNIPIICGLMGMTQEMINSLESTIMDFTELGEALDRPVKTYSTGMVMRLGFSIALHLEPDIFLIDEALTVGDTNFQRKCVSRLNDIHNKRESTIVLVSHGLGDVAFITDRLILLNKGEIVNEGPSEKVLAAYWQQCEADRKRIGFRTAEHKSSAYGDDLGTIKIRDVRFSDGNGFPKKVFRTGEPLLIEINVEAQKPVENPLFRVQFFRNDGVMIHGLNTYRHNHNFGTLTGTGTMRLFYETLNFIEGDYFISIGIWPDEYRSFMMDVAYDYHEKGYSISVVSSRHHGAGIVYQAGKWEYTPSENSGNNYLPPKTEE